MPRRKLAVPRLSGTTLRMTAALSRTRAGAAATGAIVRRELGVHRLGDLPAEWRGRLRKDASVIAGRPPRAPEDRKLGPLPARAWPRSHADFARAYAEGALSPVDVTRRAFAAARSLGDERRPLDPLLRSDQARALAEAEASMERYRGGAPRGPLDGVPITVKEQLDVAGLPTQVGAAWMPETPVQTDSTAVQRLRAAGAVILGHTPMTELGFSPVGLNPQRAMPRNAHRDDHAPGGSSSGAGVAATLGLSPVAVGVDGGGSIRIPAALNGVFGLKPTYGRVSRAGEAFEGTFNHIGPLGPSTADLAAFLTAAAGEDPRDPRTHGTPEPLAGAWGAALGRGVRGLRLGVLEEEIADAESEVARACQNAINALEREGAILVPLPFPPGPHALAVGVVLIGTEGYADGAAWQRAHRAEIGLDLRLSDAIIRGFSATDVAEALMLREGLRTTVASLLHDVDALLMPTTRTGAPRVSDTDARFGVLDANMLLDLCRYTVLGNLVGLPAATCPVGTDAAGMPVGLQVMGDAFDEATVLAICAHLERTQVAVSPKPPRGIDLLG